MEQEILEMFGLEEVEWTTDNVVAAAMIVTMAVTKVSQLLRKPDPEELAAKKRRLARPPGPFGGSTRNVTALSASRRIAAFTRPCCRAFCGSDVRAIVRACGAVDTYMLQIA